MLKKLFLLTGALLILSIAAPANCGTIGSVDYKEIITNYSKARAAYEEIDDRATELQRYLLDKEKEFKKIESPIQKKAFEEKTAKDFAAKQEAYAKFKSQKEETIDKEIEAAVKSVAIDNKLDAVLDYRIIYFGSVDVTDKVIKKLNLK